MGYGRLWHIGWLLYRPARLHRLAVDYTGVNDNGCYCLSLLTTGVVDIASKFITGVHKMHSQSMVISENYQRPRESWFKKKTKSKISWHCPCKPVWCIVRPLLLPGSERVCMLKPNSWMYNIFEVSESSHTWVFQTSFKPLFLGGGGGGGKRGPENLQVKTMG